MCCMLGIAESDSVVRACSLGNAMYAKTPSPCRKGGEEQIIFSLRSSKMRRDIMPSIERIMEEYPSPNYRDLSPITPSQCGSDQKKMSDQSSRGPS